MKVKLIILAVIAVAFTFFVFIGAFITVDKTRFHNGFIRIFPPHAADECKIVAIKNRASIVGISDQSFYVRDGVNLTAISLDFLDTCLIPVENSSAYEITVDSPYFLIQSGASAHLQWGNSRDWCIDGTYTGIPGFTAVQQISKNSAVLTIIDPEMRKTLFTKTNDVNSRKDILQKQVDGIFCTDGFLLYSQSEGMLVYAYRYRNQVICMDTSLNVLREFNTIDTTSVARIEVAEIGGKITMSKPPFVVNKGACLDGINLYVYSNLVASNELVDEARNKNVIDVYNITNGSYLFSFYTGHSAKSKMTGFKVKDGVLIAAFSHHIIRYDLASK